MWSFAEGLDLSALYRAIKAVEGHPGHPPADPRILLALWLYATVEGVGSARELDRLCREHIGFEWLCGGVGMNHTTLAEFRVAHGAVLERLLVDSFAAMLKTGRASLDRVAQDGMRVRALLQRLPTAESDRDREQNQAATWNSSAIKLAWARMSRLPMPQTCPFLIIASAS